MNATNQHAKLLKGVDRSVTNNVAQWVEQLKMPEQGKRLQGATSLLVCSLIDPARMKRENVGDQIAAACEREDAIEPKMVMLATLDVLGHPSLSNLLTKAGQSDDLMVRNLVTFIKEKHYLEPVVVEDP